MNKCNNCWNTWWDVLTHSEEYNFCPKCPPPDCWCTWLHNCTGKEPVLQYAEEFTCNEKPKNSKEFLWKRVIDDKWDRWTIIAIDVYDRLIIEFDDMGGEAFMYGTLDGVDLKLDELSDTQRVQSEMEHIDNLDVVKIEKIEYDYWNYADIKNICILKINQLIEDRDEQWKVLNYLNSKIR